MVLSTSSPSWQAGHAGGQSRIRVRGAKATSTWTSRLRFSAALLLIPLLAACAPLGPGPGIRALALLDGAVVAQGPEGYCVNERASRPATGFAVMGGCALIAALPVMPRTEALITVQFGDAGSAAVAGREGALAALLDSTQGGGAPVLEPTARGDPGRHCHTGRGGCPRAVRRHRAASGPGA